MLEFRKLREGIIASGRQDTFAVEVYETSAELAILACNTPQVGTVLPHLVRKLHWPVQTGDLEDQMAKLDIQRSQAKLPRTPMDTRARSASYYLLHTLLAMRDRAAFSRLLADLVDFTSSGDVSPKIPHDSPHIAFVLQIFHIDLLGNYAALSKILANREKYNKFAWLIVRSSMAERMQEHAWQVLRASYLAATDRTWLAQSLQLETGKNGQALQVFLTKKEWAEHVDPADGAILLKKSRKTT